MYILSLLCLAGLYVSDQLVEIHALATSGAADTGICASGAGFSCNDAALSSLGKIAGVPVAALGFAFYLCALLMVIARRFWAQLPPLSSLPDVFVLGALMSALYSVFLGIMSVAVIGKLCPLCIVLYGINLALLITAWKGHPEGGLAALKRTTGLIKNPSLWATAIIFTACLPVANILDAHHTAVAASKAPKQTDLTKQAPAEIPIVEVKVGKSPTQGSQTALIEVVEFSDFECPYCRRLADNLKEASRLSPELFRYTFKHFPMDSSCNRGLEGIMHENACDAAVAMVCAHRQGKAWEMHDTVFENQKGLSKSIYTTFATKIGIDPESFGACMADPSALAEVKANIDEGMALEVDGTPTWFVNGIRQVGARPAPELVAIFEHLAREKRKAAGQ